MNASTATSNVAAALLAAGLSFGFPAASFADISTLPSCGENNSACSWSIEVGDAAGGGLEEVGSGTYSVDDTGNISFEGETIDLGDGSSVAISNLFGNIDPILGFNASAGTGALGKTFAFNFSLPIALSGPIIASSSVSYSLTATSGAGAQIAPLFGHVVVAQEIDTSVGGLPPANKGVDVGDTFFFLGGPQTQNSSVFTAANPSFAGNSAYDTMSVTVAFSLSAQSNVGLSGFVQQTPVPEPSTYAMLLAGLFLVGFVARRRLTS
jgi:hypothetical protein